MPGQSVPDPSVPDQPDPDESGPDRSDPEPSGQDRRSVPGPSELPHQDPFDPRRRRDPGDAWVDGERGRFWGRFGAAGLVAHDPERGVLMQLRAEPSQHGGTWGLPGGALREGEDAVTGALREAAEEAGVPTDSIDVREEHVFDVGYWRYTTVLGHVTAPFEPVIGDWESADLRWVPLDQVANLPLHPAFSASWPALRERLERMTGSTGSD